MWPKVGYSWRGVALIFLPLIARRLALREAKLLAHTARGTFLSLALAALLFSVTLLSGLGVQRAVESSGAELLGGDVEIRSVHRPVDEASYVALDGVMASARMTSLRSMMEVADNRRLVQVTAVDGAWPLKGEVVAEPANAFETMVGKGGVLLEPGLMKRFGLTPGDEIVLAGRPMTIQGAVLAMPGGFSQGPVLGPRLLMKRGDLVDAGLLRIGSLFNDHLLLAVDDAALSEVATKSADIAEQQGIRSRDRRAAAPAFLQVVGRVSVAFALMVSAGLIMSAYGLRHAVMTQRRLRQGLSDDLLALGMAEKLRGRMMLTAMMLPGMLATLLGIIPGIFVIVIGASFLPVSVPFSLPVWDMMAVGAAVFAYAFVVALVALRVKTAFWHWLVLPIMSFGVFAALLGLQPGVFAAAFSLLPLFLELLAILLAPLFAKFARSPKQWVRDVARSLRQPWLMRLGFSVGAVGALAFATVLIALASVDAELEQRLASDAPSHFVVDLRRDEVAPFQQIMGEEGAKDVQTASMLRGMIKAINGVPSAEANVDEGSAWMLRGDRGITFTDDLPQGTEITDGQWWGPRAEGAFLSMAKNAASDFGITIGDQLTVDILGRPVELTVANLREINWAGGGMNFSLVVNEAVGLQLPLGFLGTFRVDEEKTEGLEARLANEFPGASVVRVGDVLEPVEALLRSLKLLLTSLAAALLIGALMVLVSALFAQIRLRADEINTRRMLGASAAQVGQMIRRETLALALLVLLVGGLMGTALVVVLFVGVLDRPVVVPWTMLLAGLLVPLVVLVGGAAREGRKIMRQNAQY